MPGRSDVGIGLFPDLRPIGPDRWHLPIGTSVVGPGGLYGGAGLGCAVALLESITGDRCLSANAQFLAPVRAGDSLELDVRVPERSGRTTRAVVIGRAAGRDALSVHAALGQRDSEDGWQGPAMPEVVGPDAAVALALGGPDASIFDRLEVRATDPGAAGARRLWARLDRSSPLTSACLAVLADLGAMSLRHALDDRRISSLDNTLRVVQPGRGHWVLIDADPPAVAGSVGHVAVRLWAVDGSLLAIGGQTCLLRTTR